MDIHIFWYWSHVLTIFFFKVLVNPSATTDFLSLYVEYISISFFSSPDLTDLL